MVRFSNRSAFRLIMGTAGLAFAVSSIPASATVPAAAPAPLRAPAGTAQDPTSGMLSDGKLPPPGSSHQLELSASQVRFSYQGRECTVSLQGEVQTQVEAELPHEAGDNVIPTNEEGLRMRGQAPSCAGSDRQAPGDITIEQSDTETTPDSSLKMVSQQPPKFEQTMLLNFTVTVEQPPSQDRAGSPKRAGESEPLVLTTKNPAKLVGHIGQFPPESGMYQLRNPIELVLPNNPEETVATIDKFPVKVGGL